MMKILICDKTEKEAIEQMRCAGLQVDRTGRQLAEALIAETPIHGRQPMNGRQHAAQF